MPHKLICVSLETISVSPLHYSSILINPNEEDLSTHCTLINSPKFSETSPAEVEGDVLFREVTQDTCRLVVGGTTCKVFSTNILNE